MSELQIISLNMRGLKENNKRRIVFNKIQKYKGLILLQETHSSPEIEKLWQSEFGGKIIFSHGTTQSRGTALLIHNETDITIHKQAIHEHGRYASGT